MPLLGADGVLRPPTPRVFVPLLGPATYKGAYGGRGSGKSHFFAEYVVERCISEPGLRVVCVREVQKSLMESAKQLIEGKIQAFGVGHMFDVQADRIKTPGGGVIIFQGMKDHTAESIKSLENFSVAWVEEAQVLTSRSLELLDPTIRAPGSEMLFSWNPRNASDPVDSLFRGSTPPSRSVVVRANWNDNPFFPPELNEKRRHAEKHNRDRYAHIWEGAYEPAAIGAIWDRVKIAQSRREVAPTLNRIVVAIDPAVSNEPHSDHHGIGVAARGDDQHGYVIEDATIKGTPQEWAERAVALYDAYEADAIVIEVNQGGDMCRHTLQSIRQGLRIVEVRATRGKHVRAEPIASLYSLGRIHHVGSFPELEDEMCLMTASGYEGPGSPNRVDWLVWAMTELFPGMVRKPADPTPPVNYGNGGWMG